VFYTGPRRAAKGFALMPYIVVTSERPPGSAALFERVVPADFETESFRARLAERLAWAVTDAERELVGDGPVYRTPELDR
jgi:hypothetical protein